jgi:hypothetical protein
LTLSGDKASSAGICIHQPQRSITRHAEEFGTLIIENRRISPDPGLSRKVCPEKVCPEKVCPEKVCPENTRSLNSGLSRKGLSRKHPQLELVVCPEKVCPENTRSLNSGLSRNTRSLNSWFVPKHPQLELVKTPNARMLVLDDQPKAADDAIATFVRKIR